MTSVSAPAATFDVNAAIDAAVAFLRDYLARSGQSRYVIGLSGGIDSAVTAFLAARAVGRDRVMLIAMPYGLKAPGRFAPSADASLSDAERVAAALPGTEFILDDIAPVVDSFAIASERVAVALERSEGADRYRNPWRHITSAACAPVLGNLKARTRAVRLRMFANMYRGLVLGTENATEHYLGYFTIGGDEESDIEVLPAFTKTEVRALARALGVPSPVIIKAPSADLWAGQTDEAELGFSYEEADSVVRALQAECHPFTDTSLDEAILDPAFCRAAHRRTSLSHDRFDAVVARIRATAFKRAPRPTFAGVPDAEYGAR